MEVSNLEKLMTPNHPWWDTFIDSLGGLTGIRTHLEVDKIVWDCPHSMQFPLSRSILDQYPEINIDDTLEWFFMQDWWCDCEVFFYSDATLGEREIGLQKK